MKLKKIIFALCVGCLLPACTPETALDHQQPSKPDIDRPVPEPEPEPGSSVLVPPPEEGTVYATWINVWNTSSRTFVFDENSTYGLQCEYPDGTWKAMDWNNPEYRQMTYRNLQKAGIDVILTDNTNGTLDKTDLLVRDVEEGICPLQFAVVFSYEETISTHAQEWLDRVSKTKGYFHLDGKPLLVYYGYQDKWFSEYKDAVNNPFLQRYSRKLACRDSFADKWGWQYRPEDAVVPSSNSMFVSPAVWHLESGQGQWHRSMALLDYTFWQTRKAAPDYVVVGSYDDYSERNGWMPLKTQDAADWGKMKYRPVSQIQNFDPWTGKIADPYMYYERVCAWISGQPLYEVPDGSVADGVYKLRNVESRRYLQSTRDILDPVIKTGMSYPQTYDKFVLYHLGQDEYRLVNVFTGKPLRVSGDDLVSADWTGDEEGRFTLRRFETESSADGQVGKEAQWELIPLGTFARDQEKMIVLMSDSENRLVTNSFQQGKVTLTAVKLPPFHDDGLL